MMAKKVFQRQKVFQTATRLQVDEQTGRIYLDENRNGSLDPGELMLLRCDEKLQRKPLTGPELEAALRDHGKLEIRPNELEWGSQDPSGQLWINMEFRNVTEYTGLGIYYYKHSQKLQSEIVKDSQGLKLVNTWKVEKGISLGAPQMKELRRPRNRAAWSSTLDKS